MSLAPDLHWMVIPRCLWQTLFDDNLPSTANSLWWFSILPLHLGEPNGTYWLDGQSRAKDFVPTTNDVPNRDDSVLLRLTTSPFWPFNPASWQTDFCCHKSQLQPPQCINLERISLVIRNGKSIWFTRLCYWPFYPKRIVGSIGTCPYLQSKP